MRSLTRRRSWASISAGVYSSFDRTVHVKKLTVNPTIPLLWALDFNGDPMSSVIAQEVRGKLMVLGEIVIRRGTTREACEEFLRRFPKHDPGIGYTATHRDITSKRRIVGLPDDPRLLHGALYHAGKYKAPKANPAVRDRLNLTNAKLRTAAGEVPGPARRRRASARERAGLAGAQAQGAGRGLSRTAGTRVLRGLCRVDRGLV